MFTWKKAAIGVSVLLLLLLGWAAWVLAQPSEEPAFSSSAYLHRAQPLRLTAALRTSAATAATLPSRFPYHAYLDSADLSDARQLGLDAQVLDSLYPANPRDNERLLYTVLTDSLAARQLHGASAGADSMARLQHIMTWAAQLPVAARYEPRRATFFQALQLFWVKEVASSLEQMYRRNPAIKYSFQFKHLNQLCREAKCGVPVAFSAPEKVMNNLVEGQWGYLLTKFLRDSSLLTKVVAGGVAALGLLSFLALLSLARHRLSLSNE